jgi:hypothetical protein
MLYLCTSHYMLYSYIFPNISPKATKILHDRHTLKALVTCPQGMGLANSRGSWVECRG